RALEAVAVDALHEVDVGRLLLADTDPGAVALQRVVEVQLTVGVLQPVDQAAVVVVRDGNRGAGGQAGAGHGRGLPRGDVRRDPERDEVGDVPRDVDVRAPDLELALVDAVAVRVLDLGLVVVRVVGEDRSSDVHLRRIVGRRVASGRGDLRVRAAGEK